LLTVRSLTHRYGATTVLAAQDFVLGAGEHAVLLGPSGSGKTTLLHVLAGILPPSAGVVELAGENLYAPKREDRWRAARIGVVPQKLHLIGALSALDNVRIAQRLAGSGRDAVGTAAAAAAGKAAKGDDDAAALLSRICTSGRRSFLLGSSSVAPLRARSSIVRACCWPTSRPRRSTAPMRRPPSICCSVLRMPAAQRSSSPRMMSECARG